MSLLLTNVKPPFPIWRESPREAFQNLIKNAPPCSDLDGAVERLKKRRSECDGSVDSRLVNFYELCEICGETADFMQSELDKGILPPLYKRFLNGPFWHLDQIECWIFRRRNPDVYYENPIVFSRLYV